MCAVSWEIIKKQSGSCFAGHPVSNPCRDLPIWWNLLGVWLKYFSSNFYCPFHYKITGLLQKLHYPTATPVFCTLSASHCNLVMMDMYRSPLEHLVLSIPCLAADPAVIEDIRLVIAAHIRLGGPKRQNGFYFEGKTRIHRIAPRKKWWSQLDIFT